MNRKAIPLFEFDPTREAIIEPSEIFKKQEVPEKCVICFFKSIIEKWEKEKRIEKIAKITTTESVSWMYKYTVDEAAVDLLFPGIGAPLAAMHLEFSIATGCSKFLVIGSGGVLDSDLNVGKLVLLDSAIRDEGTSYHYLEAAREIQANRDIVTFLESELKHHNVDFIRGKAWTTDAICRETPKKIKMRKEEGAIVVEMEAASLFAVSQFRNVKMGYLIYCGDDVSGEKWDIRKEFDRKPIREKALELAFEIIRNL